MGWAPMIQRPAMLWFIFLVVMFSTKSHGQEAIRMSLASEQAAAATKISTGSNYYNLQAGPVYLRFRAEMGIELNDNVNYSHSSPDTDLGFRPNLDLRAYWPVTERNTMVLSTSVGYVEYIHDPGLSHVNITSDSGLGFNVYSGDFVFNLHDRFSAVDYQVQDPSVSASLIRLENTVGLGTTWDLDKLVLTAGYDHDTFSALTHTYQFSDNNSELFNGKAAFLLSSTSKVGLEAGGGLTSFDKHILDDSAQYSVGPFYQSRFTPNLTGNISVGVASYEFDHNGSAGVDDFLGFYASGSVYHQLSASFFESLSAGRKIQRGITADLSEDYYADYEATWRINRHFFTSLRFWFDHGSTLGASGVLGFVDEKYDRYGPGVTFGWRISGKVQALATYSYLGKDSDVAFYSYNQNRLLLDVTYDF
jgi:hypothetical protein